MYPRSMASTQVGVQQEVFVSKVYAWMSAALFITAFVAFIVASNDSLAKMFLSNRGIFYGLLIAEFLLVMGIGAMINNMSAATATVLFIGYAALNGLTFSVIFLLFTTASIASTFLVTASTFGIMSIYGYYTKRDLTTIGNLCLMSLFGLIIASIVNIFFSNSTLYWITTYAGILIFVGLTAYDTQKIKEMGQEGMSGEIQNKAAIMGALALYLDFINLFLFLLRLFGRRR